MQQQVKTQCTVHTNAVMLWLITGVNGHTGLNLAEMKINLLFLAVTLVVVAAPPDMSIKDVAKYLRCHNQNRANDGRRQPATRLHSSGDRVIRFRRSEVDAALTPTPTPGAR